MLHRLTGLRRRAAMLCAATTLCLVPMTLSHAQQPDNSAVNKGQQPTADNQSSRMSDREITAKIRRDLVADKSLSTYGHNVKIITQGGMVTLKGPVHSAEERRAVETRAVNVAGQGKVTDQLTVKQ